MGLTACFTEVNQESLDQLKEYSEDLLFEAVEELQNPETYTMGKLWDGLHCLLTGESASEPIENNLLSEAIVGKEVFEPEGDFIAYTKPEHLPAVLSALDQFDIQTAVNMFEPEFFDKKGIYPDIWIESRKKELKVELLTAFQELRIFYQNVIERENGVVVSIY